MTGNAALRRAFVAGATGYTGREVVRALTSEGVRTVAHVRPDSPRLEDWRARFEAMGAEVDQTPWQPDAMRATCRRLRPDLVFGLLGTTRKRARAEGPVVAGDPYEAIDYALTAMLLDAAVRCDEQPRFVYLSAIGVTATSRTAYMRARWKCEEAIRASGLPFVIARPSFISGPGRDDGRPAERVGAAVADRALALCGVFGLRRLRDRYSSLSGAELGCALVRLALDPAVTGVVEADRLRGPQPGGARTKRTSRKGAKTQRTQEE